MFKRYCWLLVLFFVFFVRGSGFSQSAFVQDLTVSGHVHHGWVLPEYQNLTYVVEKPLKSIGFSFEKRTRGKNIWEQIFNYPSFGVEAFYTSLGNDNIHGHEFAVYPYYNLYIIDRAKLAMFQQIGVGLSYVSKKYDENTNYLNVAVGSHLNIHFNLRFGLQYYMTKRINLQSGVSFDHFSNGNFQEPNLGINAVTLYGGVGYNIGEKRDRLPIIKGDFQRDFHFEFIYSFGAKRARALSEIIYVTSSVSAEFKYELFRIFYVGLGADLFYDQSTKADVEILYEGDYSKIDDYTSGVHLTQELIYNKIGLVLQEGFYLGLRDPVAQRVMYNRGAVKYRFTKKMFAMIAMKSHLHILDYAELGIGFIW